ncbi:MAG: hypothetical protein KJ737_14995 [Proteobacteria bacterium]|nr:hypothetical protein [Pseudomonadota bacterium]
MTEAAIIITITGAAFVYLAGLLIKTVRQDSQCGSCGNCSMEKAGCEKACDDDKSIS